MSLEEDSHDGLTFLLVLDLIVSVVWVGIAFTLLGLQTSDYDAYRSIHASYVSHAMATLRLIYICCAPSRRSRGHRWKYTVSVFTVALVFDIINVIMTHMYTPQTVFWAWTVDVTISYAFVALSATMVLYGFIELRKASSLLK